ncbi:lysophospholipid acyltransferase family protein [Roseisalinus antarcticus]|uniref:DUF374 domain-containing protein n=1 Tax=Roseisalinus antarcticus TaxID=254357 RepID=A0A1Y5U0D7_9RHOB|nr:DUF374 domain-containing protein [Roseisalinus antarcticus]SLN77967.1 hypothetical protein ROA7023_04614 [Roseisalinus antarcticus]
MARTLRKRLEKSTLLAGALGRLVAGYLRFCAVTTRWQAQGLDDLKAATAQGPVIVVMWHSRLMLGQYHVPRHVRRVVSLRESSVVGRVAAVVQSRLGLGPVAMTDGASNRGASRSVLRALRTGSSLGLTADGPLGPALEMKAAPLDWARTTGVPLFLFAYATKRQRRADSWDRLLLPLPFTRGSYGFQRWELPVGRRASEVELTAARDALARALTTHQHDIDRLTGLPPGP